MKLVFCLRRRSDLSREEFQRYWRETHGPLVATHAETLGIRRYVQVHTGHDAATQATMAGRGAPEPYDGVAELWFDDDALDPAKATDSRREAAAALFEDETRFIDHTRSPIFFADEHTFVDS